ncbi:ATP-binding protein [Verrucomicrobium sp. BvORR106]|uniref:AAA family ATPase n=1 Tax=Verrucomicrobium sp. BvORR106 TaxID=1403819 RepID=UPI00056FF4F1|nr:ATP-binding protein [Verrucomicrobium sp. BvORR106]
MKSRLHRLEIRNFKAFREPFTLELEGRHLLVYGSNGSGKSSLYWALYTFLQSANKPTPGVAKYFDPADPQNLLNIHEKDPATKPGEIALTLRDIATKNDTTYRISQTVHGTRQQPAILKGDLASDFITYRFFFGFSDFRNSQTFNVWPLFEKEILPFCVTTAGGRQTPVQMWNAIRSGQPNPYANKGRAGTYAYADFHSATKRFAAILPGIIDAISSEAQSFYDTHFAKDDQPRKITLKLGLTTPPSSSGDNQAEFRFTPPAIGFGVKIDGRTIDRPQSFLNEAKMTQLALSVRFAASLVNLHESDLKLLVLDDLLVSLDMSNRMKVVEILLSDTFENYQKLILTHELGFFREFRRKLGPDHPNWSCVSLEGTPATAISGRTVKTDLQKAEEYLNGYNLDEAALCLRKVAEDTAKRFIDHNEVLPTKDFVGLTEALRAARNKIQSELPVELYEKVVRNTPNAHRNLLIASDDSDLDGNTALDPQTKGRLKTNRNRLRSLISTEHVERLKTVKLIDDILACTERVLNPAAHSGSPPLYKKEVQDALDLIAQLEIRLAS